MMTANWYSRTKHLPGVREKHNAQGKAWKDAHPEKVAAYSVKAKLSNPERYMLKAAKTRAKKRGQEFTISIEDIVIPTHCPIMKEPLEFIPGRYHNYSPSLDRIDSTKGYIKGNIQVISSLANRMKWDATQEQLIKFATGVLAMEVDSCL